MKIEISKELAKKIDDEVSDYPDHYDAHYDSLAGRWDQNQSVNQLLKLLREVRSAIKKGK